MDSLQKLRLVRFFISITCDKCTYQKVDGYLPLVFENVGSFDYDLSQIGGTGSYHD